MAKLDFCCSCGCWITADAGTMRESPDGTVEIICKECLALELGRACSIRPDSRAGGLDAN